MGAMLDDSHINNSEDDYESYKKHKYAVQVCNNVII